MNLQERDRAIMWHPLTQEKTAAWPIPIRRAKGSYVYDEDDRAYLDLISSWWVNLHGHAHPDIAEAIYQQACTLEHIIFAGFTHEPAVQLCERLNQLLPDNLCRFFFSDNGSTAVEVALKMASQYWLNREQQVRPLFLSFEGGYHGDTFGAMAVGAKSGFHDAFQHFFFKVLSVPFPETWEGDAAQDAKEAHALLCLDAYLDEYGEQIAALIVEPLIQGSSGMRMCSPLFIKRVGERVRARDILVIFDEVMTGFGRTGTHFALDQIGFSPDFLCVSKGISGGFLPLALTVTTETVYQAFLSDHWQQAFAHSHSYTANPIACAAGIASLQLLCADETQHAIRAIHTAHHEGLAYLKQQCTCIEKIRVRGSVAAFDVSGPHAVDFDQTLKAALLSRGLLLRPLGHTIYLLPPYSITVDELRGAYEIIAEVLLKIHR
jgi:adenosylmethionine-8-amino-7-oxononanoate aminotransferase